MVRQDGQITDDSRIYLCFKVEDERPVMFLLHVDDLFLTRKEELIKGSRRRLAAEFKMKDLDIMHYFLRHGGVVECGWNLPGTREVCSRDPEVV